MGMYDKFWQKLSTAILWGSTSGLLLLFPVMIYLLQPAMDIEQKEIRAQVALQKSVLSEIRAETALLTTGYRSNSHEEILTLLEQLFASVYRVDLELNGISYDVAASRRSWERYQESLEELQEIILEISSASALYGFTISQLEPVFDVAEKELQTSMLPEKIKRAYDLQLVKMMVLALRYAAMPTDGNALILEEHLSSIRQSSLTIPSSEAQTAFTKVVNYVDGLLNATTRIRKNSARLMNVSTYEHLKNFDSRFEQWLDNAQKQQHQSRWSLLIAVVLLTGAIVVILIRLKLIQDRLLRTNTQLSAYKKAMDEHSIVSITDPRGVIQYINQKFIDVSGFEPDELIGRTHKVINSGVHPKGFFKNLWNHIGSGDIWHDEVCNRRKDGTLYWVNATVIPMFDARGKVTSIISVRTDISDLKQTQRALTSEKERAEVANKAKGDFLANMSHEIRTPMNAVIGMSHLARQASQDEQVGSYIDKIQQAAQNLLSIINDILDFSKIEAGRLDVENIPFRLDNVVNHLADLASVKANEKNLPLLFNVDERIPNSLKGDPLRLGQILLNLVNNAIKFTAKGQVVVEASLLEQRHDIVQVRFSVVDTGIGLSKEQVGRLFKSFSQADTSTTRQYGGTGLGLAISKQLVELMHGEIGVHATEGEGSEFFFTLPLQVHAVDEQIEKVDSSRIRVLAIDDDTVSLQCVCEHLEAQGITVDIESDSPAGLNRLVNAHSMGEEPYNVLLIDWQMPVMDGFEVAKAVRHNSALPIQPAILMLTAYGGEDLQRRINHNLIDGVLLKPVSGSHLLNAIQEAVVKRGKKHKSSRIRGLFRDGDEINALLGAHVLIAEDNGINQEVITGLLEPYGLVLTLASNGREAVDLVQQKEFDLIFMDIQMPEVDGYQATEQILQMKLPKPPIIIAMTAHAQSEDVSRCLELGMSDHISKPINPDILKEKLIQWIEPRVISGYAPESLASEEQIDMPCYLHGVDLNKALHSMGGNKKLLMKLMGQFCNDYHEGLAPLKASMATGDWDYLIRWMHTLKGTSATLGMEQITAFVEVLEQQYFDQSLPSDDDLRPLSDELAQVIDDIANCMQSKGQRASLMEMASAKDHELLSHNLLVDHDFVASLQPPMSKNSTMERLGKLHPKIAALLEEGDPDVLDDLPELLELAQVDAELLSIAVQVMEYAEVYEFDEALAALNTMKI